MKFRLRRNKSPLKSFIEKNQYPVVPAFELAGRTFYRFADINNQPAGRTLAAIPLYIELKTNCDEDYLKLFVSGMEAVLNDPASISIEKLITLKNQIKDRLSWAFTPDLVYRFASVTYFDETENPETYDEVYNQQKVAFWKQHAGMKDFFLAEPITKLIPALNAVRGSFLNYSGAILKAQSLQLDALWAILSTARISNEEKQSLSSQITNLKESLSFDHYPLTNTSSSSMKNLNTEKN